MKKRILSLFLAVVMAVGLLPMSAFAAEYEATEMTIPNTYCTINPAMDYEENGAVEFYKWGSLYPSITKYVVQVPAGTERVVITLGNSICLTPDYYEPTQNNFYYGTMTWSENADGYGTAGYTGRESEVSYTVIDAETSSIELDVASLIAGEKMFYTIDGSWNPLYAIEFEYAASSGGHECSWNAGAVTKAATCQETGIKTYTCTVSGCGETKTGVIPLADHNWNSGEVTTAPTCQTDGTKTFACQTSGCKEAKTEKIAASADYHAWNSGEVTWEATCKEAGVRTYSCTVSGCDETKTESIVKLTTHTYGEDGKAEYCSVCETALNPDYVDPNMPELVEGVYQIGTAD
ncbi:MAG: hypothetical protein IKU62_04030, partial [Ruminiclostridium sp.]|nr:hypothetical protein [Ruminiclostridium sp.]